MDAATGERQEVPSLGLADVYKGVGIRRRLDGKMQNELEHVQQLCQASIAQLRGRKLGEHEWVREAASRCGGVVAYHATACGDLALWQVMEARVERALRAAHRTEFGLPRGTPIVDLYLTMGWVHLAAEAAGAMHSKMCDALGDVVDSPLRLAARSSIALVLLIYQASCLIDQFVHNVNARIVVSDHPDEQSGCGIVCL